MHQCEYFIGPMRDIKKEYNEFLRDANVKVISSSITKNYGKHGIEDGFVLIVTFELFG